MNLDVIKVEAVVFAWARMGPNQVAWSKEDVRPTSLCYWPVAIGSSCLPCSATCMTSSNSQIIANNVVIIAAGIQSRAAKQRVCRTSKPRI